MGSVGRPGAAVPCSLRTARGAGGVTRGARRVVASGRIFSYKHFLRDRLSARAALAENERHTAYLTGQIEATIDTLRRDPELLDARKTAA